MPGKKGECTYSACLGPDYLGPDKGPWATAYRLARILQDMRKEALRFHDLRVASVKGNNGTKGKY